MTDRSPANSPLVAARRHGEEGQPDDEGPLANILWRLTQVDEVIVQRDQGPDRALAEALP